MASIQSIAITKEKAYASLQLTTESLSQKLGIEAPDLDIHKRNDLAYLNAQELKRLADWLEVVVEKLPSQKAPKPKRKPRKASPKGD